MEIGRTENGTLKRVKRDRSGSARLEKSPLNVYYYNNNPVFYDAHVSVCWTTSYLFST